MWGATPVTPSVAETVTERTGVRWLPAYGASELPVIAVQPGRRPDGWRLDSRRPAAGRAWSCASPTSTPASRSRPARSARSRPARPSVMAGYLPERRHGRRLRRRLVPHRRRRLARARGLGPPHRPVQGDDQGQRVPGGAGRGRGGAARAPRRRSTARCSASPTSGPARCSSRRCSSTRTARSSADELGARRRLARHLQAAAATSWSWTRSRACPRARCCAESLKERSWTSV